MGSIFLPILFVIDIGLLFQKKNSGHIKIIVIIYITEIYMIY
jgi:hypothetical protein